MVKSHKLIRKFTRKIDQAVDAMTRRYPERYFADEDDFTSRFIERIEFELDGWRSDEITFRARKTTWRGGRSEEAIFGADIVTVVRVDLSGYKTSKGILVQAKCLDHGKRFDNGKWNELRQQIDRMNNHTQESYIWLYDSSGVRSVRSHAVRCLTTRRPDDLYVTRCATFLGEFVQSKHGDPRIPDVGNLDRIRDEFSSKSAISISISDNDREHDRVS